MHLLEFSFILPTAWTNPLIFCIQRKEIIIFLLNGKKEINFMLMYRFKIQNNEGYINNDYFGPHFLF